MIPRSPLLALALVASLTGCGGATHDGQGSGDTRGAEGAEPRNGAAPGGTGTPTGGDGDFTNFVAVPEDDPEIGAAIAEARRTLKEFSVALARSSSPTTHFSVKAALPTGKAAPTLEHIWVDTVRYEGGAFHGTIANEPVHLGGKAIGDPIRVPSANVSDWMIVEGDDLATMKGGFTVKVLLARQRR